jgi:hypothetical protein
MNICIGTTDKIIAKLKRVTYDEMYDIWTNSTEYYNYPINIAETEKLFVKYGWTIFDYSNHIYK